MAVGGSRFVIWCDLKLSTGCNGSGTSQEMQIQPSFVLCLEPPGISYTEICRWLLLVLGLEVPRKSQAVNQGWLLVVPGLGHLVKGMMHTEARCCLFEIFRNSEA